MPRPGMRWWHIQWGTYCSWLPGDQRGFRSRKHRIHSSGDYKRPPPPQENALLREFHRTRNPRPVRIPRRLRLATAMAIAGALIEAGFRVLAISVSQDTLTFWLNCLATEQRMGA